MSCGVRGRFFSEEYRGFQLIFERARMNVCDIYIRPVFGKLEDPWCVFYVGFILVVGVVLVEGALHVVGKCRIYSKMSPCSAEGNDTSSPCLI